MYTAMRYSEDKYVLCLCWAVHALLTLDICTPGSTGPWLSLVPILLTHLILKPTKFWTGTIPLAFSASSLQWADGGTSVSTVMWADSHHKYLSIFYMCKSSRFCFSGELQVIYLAVLATVLPGNSLHSDTTVLKDLKNIVLDKKKKFKLKALHWLFHLQNILKWQSTTRLNRWLVVRS